MQRQRGKSGDPGLSPTSATPSAAATSSTAAARTAARPGTAAGSLPAYQPSKVVSEASGHTLLSTADSVSKVTRFYENALKDQGWRIVSTAKTAARATIVAMHGTRGAGILISSAARLAHRSQFSNASVDDLPSEVGSTRGPLITLGAGRWA